MLHCIVHCNWSRAGAGARCQQRAGAGARGAGSSEELHQAPPAGVSRSQGDALRTPQKRQGCCRVVSAALKLRRPVCCGGLSHRAWKSRHMRASKTTAFHLFTYLHMFVCRVVDGMHRCCFDRSRLLVHVSVYHGHHFCSCSWQAPLASSRPTHTTLLERPLVTRIRTLSARHLRSCPLCHVLTVDR